MIIRGILDNSLNGQLCLRGFAPIKELARISKADYSYQRNPIKDRSDIIDFLETQTYLFFPEIILSYKVKHSFDKSDKTPLSLIQSGLGYKSNVDNTQIKVKKVPFPKFTDVSGKNDIRIVDLIIDETEINDEDRPLHRIDGNHRLKAAEQSNDSKVERMVAPFCIILGEEFYRNNSIVETTDTVAFNKATKVFFYNINTKTIPLTSEENLRVLIDDKENFSDSELENIFSGTYPIKTRDLKQKASPDIFTGIKHVLQKQFRTHYNEIFRILLSKGESESEVVEKVFESLKAIEQLYMNESKLTKHKGVGLFYAFLFYHITDNSRFDFFKKWVLSNNICDISETKAETIIEIFNKVAGRTIKVFVAMPYFSEEEVESANEIYTTTIAEIATKNKINIELSGKIMTYEGATLNIVQDILEKIRDCNICVCDITNNNPNVTYEMGWARALGKPVIILREKSSEKPKSDYSMDYYDVYNKTAHTSLKKMIKKNLQAVLEKELSFAITK